MSRRAPRTRRQVAARAHYDAYIDSPAWWRRRAAWAAAQPDPDVIVCVVCGRAWDLRHDDLHHISYRRLGAERDEDLWPVHRVCHDALHAMIVQPSYRRLPRETANRYALAALRRVLGLSV